MCPTLHTSEKGGGFTARKWVLSPNPNTQIFQLDTVYDREICSLRTRPSNNRKGGSGTSAGVEVFTAEC